MKFEIYYSNSMVAGSTLKEWKEASDEDIQVVIIEFDDGHIERFMGIDFYEYEGVMKKGAWTDIDNFRSIVKRSDKSELFGRPCK